LSDFGARLIKRLEQAATRNQQALDNSQGAKEKLAKVLPILERDKQGNQIALAAMREVYSLLEADGETRQTTIEELKEAKGLLEKSAALLEQAGFDFDNIRTISNDEIWLADHLETIKRVVAIVNLQKLEVALDELEQERFEDFAHAVKRSGEKRQHVAAPALTASTDAATAATLAIEATKAAIEAIDEGPKSPPGMARR
jgi:hypothetical protein